MKKLFLYILVLCIVSACQKQIASFENSYELQNTPEQVQLSLLAKQKLEMQELQKIKLEIGYTDFFLSKEKKTWKELDNFYQSLPEKCKNPNYLVVLQEGIVKLMLNDYGLLELNDEDAISRIDFYAEKLFVSRQIDSELAYKCLSKMKSKWSSEKFNKYLNMTVANVEKSNRQLHNVLKELNGNEIPDHFKNHLNEVLKKNGVYLAKLKSI